MSNAVSGDIQRLISKELYSANEKFPQFSSTHEACAVIYEEVEEAKEELEDIVRGIKEMWVAIRNNDLDGFKGYLPHMEAGAICLACEAIQIAAMCEKAQNFVNSMEGK